MASRLSYKGGDEDDIINEATTRLVGGGEEAQVGSTPTRPAKKTSVIASPIPISTDDSWGDFEVDSDDSAPLTLNSASSAATTKSPSSQQPTMYDFDNGQPSGTRRANGPLKLPASTNQSKPKSTHLGDSDDGSVLILDDSDVIPTTSGGLRSTKGGSLNGSGGGGRVSQSLSGPSHHPMPEVSYDSYQEVESPTEYQLYQRIKNLTTGVKITCALQLVRYLFHSFQTQPCTTILLAFFSPSFSNFSTYLLNCCSLCQS